MCFQRRKKQSSLRGAEGVAAIQRKQRKLASENDKNWIATLRSQ